MISSMLQYLKANDHLPKDYDEAFNIYFGHSNIFHFLTENNKSIAVKIAENGTDSARSISMEATALIENSKLYDGLVPKIIKFDRSESFTFFIMEGFTLTRVSLDDIFALSGNQAEIMQRFLTGYERKKSNSCANMVQALEQSIQILPDELCQQYQNIIKVRKWDKLLAGLPEIAQHGDLGLSNVGKLSGGELIVFDWEDYGIVNIPGFDLMALLIEGCLYDYRQINSLAHDIYQNKQHFLAPFTHDLNIDQQNFIDIFMINLLIFHKLKCDLGYGSEIINLCRTILNDMAQQSDS